MSKSVILHSSLLCGSQNTKHLYERRCTYKVMYLDIIYLLLFNSLVEDYVVYVGWFGVVEVASYVIR